MSDDGANIVFMMAQLKRLFEQTAALLRTADAYMKDNGWAVRGNQCVSVSTVPDRAPYWFPETAFRLYTNQQRLNLLPFVEVLFDDRKNRGRIKEPLVSAGWHDFGKGKQVPEKPALWSVTKWHRRMPARVDDGTFVSVDPRQLKQNYPMELTTTMAVPLVEITSVSDLKQRILDPLLLKLGDRQP